MKKHLKLILCTILLLSLSFALTGCYPGDGRYTLEKPAGFFSGIWHGWIAPLTLIGGLFNSKVRIYEPINRGWLYDFGFYIAIISGFGGLSLSRKKRKKD